MSKPTAQRSWEYRQRVKAKEVAAKVAAVDACGTRQEWFEKNRVELDPEKLNQLQGRHEQVLATLDWMEDGYLLDPSDECFVSIVDGVDILLDDLSKSDSPHLGYVKRNQDVPSDWSTGIWSGKKYWHDAELLQMLESEGPATALYVRYGFLSNPPDWMVVDFLTSHGGWDWNKAASVVGYCVPETGKGTSGVVSYK
jgi:hypothetical protein